MRSEKTKLPGAKEPTGDRVTQKKGQTENEKRRDIKDRRRKEMAQMKCSQVENQRNESSFHEYVLSNSQHLNMVCLTDVLLLFLYIHLYREGGLHPMGAPFPFPWFVKAIYKYI